MKAWTDYPFTLLGDVVGIQAPVREIEVINYDGDKYCDIIVENRHTSVKAGYCYKQPGRYSEVPAIDKSTLPLKSWYFGT